MSFSGSYRSDDVQFLLKPLPLHAFIDVPDKERLIQSGQRHYSEMLSVETLPTERYLKVFRDAYAANRKQMARDCLALAALISVRRSSPVTIVSLARAGTPVGVIVKHLLEKIFKHRTCHYSVSIVRDRGIDTVALQHILKRGHAPESIAFVDGWTGKGVISRELERAVQIFNLKHGTNVDGGLYVLSDLAGTAECAASCADYLIPSSILNSTVSGLISRSILNDAIGPDDFHGCVFYTQFEPHDQSQAFADELIKDGLELANAEGIPRPASVDRAAAAAISREFLEASMKQHQIVDVNLVKPGIGEATRVLLRRIPRLLILRDPEAPDVAHLKLLAVEKNVTLIVDRDLPYQAVSLIRSAVDG